MTRGAKQNLNFITKVIMSQPMKAPHLMSLRITLSYPRRQKKILKEIENKSQFFQLALDDAAGLMSWALIKKQQKLKEPDKLTPELIAEYNDAFPVDELTAKRQNKWPRNSPKKPELW